MRGRRERQAAYEALAAEVRAASPRRARRLAALYRVWSTFGGCREVHKFHVVFGLDLVRRRILEQGRALHEAGRLDSPEQVFDLTLDEADRAAAEPDLDLRARGRANREFIDRLARLAQHPTLIDSRGRILRSKAVTGREGEAVGTPISPGVARGRVKVLHAPDEKPLEKGEVLVARATDPGWTPLFVNAGAVVLEVGGLLQHGALVAREYGLPCVGGIADATSLWKDGTLVEVDGGAGVVRVLRPNSA